MLSAICTTRVVSARLSKANVAVTAFAIQEAHYVSVTHDKKNIIRSSAPGVEIPRTTLPDLVLGLSEGVKHKFRDRIAFKMHGKEVTYNQVKLSAIEFGTKLHNDLGMKTGSVMAVLSPNCLEYVPVIHGIMSVGVTATTLNPGYTPSDIAYQLNDSSADSIVVHSSLMDNLRKAEALLEKSLKHIVVVGEKPTEEGLLWFDDMIKGDGSNFPKVNVDVMKDVALLPYSSGTTGRPKGVALSHYNLTADVVQIQEGGFIPPEAGVKQLALLPMFHMYGLLMCGNVGMRSAWTMSVMSAFNPVEFLETIQRDKIELMHLVPPLVVFLAKHPIVDHYDLSSVKDVFCGAAPLGVDTINLLIKRLPHFCLRQAYGMTEVSISYIDVLPSTTGSAGILLPNTEAKFLDPTSEGEIEVAPGQVGELCIRGPQVMLGYLNRPAETAAAFTSDGFLRTGDVGYMNDANHLFIHDRLKELIKVKGFQVAPTEIEDYLIGHDSVMDAAVIGRLDEFNGELPKAFVVMKEGAKEAEEDIRLWLNSQLSEHKHLCEVEFINEIPKNPSGKILRRILRDRENARQEAKEQADKIE